MNPLNHRGLVGAMVCSLIALVIWVWPTPYVYVPIHQSDHVQTVRENRLTGRIAAFNQETKQREYHEELKEEDASSNASDIALRPAFAVAVPDRHMERAFLDTAQLHKACLLADAIVHSGQDDMRQFTPEDFRLAERCMAYVTGALDTLPGKVEIIGDKRYEFAFRDEKLLVGSAVDSFNRYVQTHPESANWSGAETLAIALVNDKTACWLAFSATQTTATSKRNAE
jgi:hypothetical protein